MPCSPEHSPGGAIELDTPALVDPPAPRRRLPTVGLAVAAFAIAVAVVAGLAGSGDDPGGLVKVPVAGDDAGAPSGPQGEGPAYRLAIPMPDLGATAPGYRLRSSTTPAAVAELARSLRLEGPVSEEEGKWVVADRGRRLTVLAEPGLPWYLGPCRWREETVAMTDPEVGCPLRHVDVFYPGPDAPSTPMHFHFGGPTMPSLAEARQLAQVAFARLGRAVDHVRVSASEWSDAADGFNEWIARMVPNESGLRITDERAQLAFGVDGTISWGTGRLGLVERLGDYPLAGVEAGLERLRSRNAGNDSAPGCFAQKAPCGESSPIVIVGVELTLESVGDLLVPMYEFRFGSFNTESVPAVADEWLERAPAT